MLLLVGLGNPGSQYAQNRHNVGFMAVEEISRRFGFGPWRRRFQGQTADGTVADTKVLALLPQTFMNLSGQAVGEAMRFFKLTPADVVVFHDELDLDPGRVKVKRGGGHGGHNGLRSIDDHIGKDYRRVRVGIGHPGHKDLVTGYVLRDFAKADETWLTPLLQTLAEAFPLLVAGDDNGYNSKVALKTQPPRQKKDPEPSHGV